ncbi:MAG: PEP-CTERM sorting domain-containing protein [Aeoliella sp.]
MASLVVCFGCASMAQALQIDAIQDTWIRESDPDGDYNNEPDGDLVSVWDGTTSDLRRHGVLLFDLTDTVGVTINQVYLDLFDRDDPRSATAGIVQEAYIISSTPPLPTGINDPYTWTEYIDFDQPNESLLDSLGHYNVLAGDTVNGYEASDFGSAADITSLETARDSNSNIVAFVLKASSGERDWGDIEEGTPPRLVINEDPPVPGDFTGDGMVTIADFNVMTDPANWLQNVPAGTLGDMTQDGFVGLDDFSNFKPIFLFNNPGSLSLVAPVPEPATLTLIAVLAAGLVGWTRRNRNLSRNDTLRGTKMQKLSIAVIVVILLAPASASAVTLEATTDVWLRESSADSTFETDLISVWNSLGGDPGTRRYGVIEFDVSSLDGVPITFAGLQLWDENNGFSDDIKPIKQSAVQIDTTGGTQASAMTWNVFQNDYAGSATALVGLGAYDFAGDPSTDGFLDSTGTAAEQTLIESIADAAGGGNQLLTLVMIADEADGVEYAHSWGDGPDGLNGMNAQLVINEPFPEPPEEVELTLQINATSGAMSIVNPGMDAAEDTMFDLDGYVIHSPDGLLNPGGFTGLVGEGETCWQIVAPTLNDLTELNLTESTLFSEGDQMSLGTGYTPGAAEDAGLTFEYSVVGSTDTTLALVEYVTGGMTLFDANVDGTVNNDDIPDFVTALLNLTDWETLHPGLDPLLYLDGDGNGFVNNDDIPSFVDALLNPPFLTSSTSAVPEPSAGVLFGLLLVVTVCRRQHLRTDNKGPHRN